MHTRELRKQAAKDVEFTHFDVRDGFATVAGVVVDGYYYYGISLCSPFDNFNKRTGRIIALRRLFEGHSMMSGTRVSETLPATIVDRAKLCLVDCLSDLQEYGHRYDFDANWYLDLNYELDISIRGKRIRQPQQNSPSCDGCCQCEC